MSRNALALTAAVAMLLGGGMQAYPRQRREFTLDEEEEQSVRRMVNRARARRRQTEWERKAEAARIAAEKEAARPKSRQELRALARENAKDPRRWDRKRRRP